MNHFEQIRVWAKERGLHDIEYQPLPQIGFLVKELHEFITAKDSNGRIDALCDMTVFSVNAIALLNRNHDRTDEEIHAGFETGDISKYVDSVIGIAKEINGYIGLCFHEKRRQDIYAMLIAFCRGAIEFLGYDYDKAMEETLKEINSRVGAFDEVKGKWVKTETKYKANYDVARIEK
jgi:hypothetical protein